MTDNRLTAAFGQVADIAEQLRDRGEAVGEQVAGKLTSGVEDAKENAQARLETAQAAFGDAVAQALARFDKAKDRLSVELPEEPEELRAKFTPEELRKVAGHISGLPPRFSRRCRNGPRPSGSRCPGTRQWTRRARLRSPWPRPSRSRSASPRP